MSHPWRENVIKGDTKCHDVTMTDNSPQISKTAQREAAALAVASGKKIGEIAKAAKTSPRTIYRWLEQADFQRLIREFESGSKNEAPEVVNALVESHQSRMMAAASFQLSGSEYRKRLTGAEGEWFDTIERVGMAQTFRDSSIALMSRLSDQLTEPEPTKRFFAIILQLAEEYVSREDNPYGAAEIDKLQSRLAPSPDELATAMDKAGKLYDRSLRLIYGDKLRVQQNLLLGVFERILSGQFSVPQLQQICRATLLEFSSIAGDVETLARTKEGKP